MASLKKRGTLYYIQFYLPGKKQRRVNLHTDVFAIAKEKLRRFESAQAAGDENPLPTRTPIGEIVTAYVEHIRTIKTAKSAQTDIYYLRDMFGPICEALRVTSRKISAKARNPSTEEVMEITQELAEYLRDLDDVVLREKLLGQYAADFGTEAAAALDHWSSCINAAEEYETDTLQYDPGHPWHYYREGDAVEPMPVANIPAAPRWDLPTPPKNPIKREAFFRQMLVDQEGQLATDKERYTQLVENGADALSTYDRTIAYNDNDDLA